MNPGIQIAQFLVEAVFSFYIIVVMLRLLFALVRADFYNPVAQFVVTLTNPPLRRLRRLIPSIGRLDTASLVLLIALELLQIYLLAWLQGFLPSPLLALVVAIRELLLLLIYIFMGAVIAQAVMSWFVAAGRGYHPLMGLLDSLTRPILEPIRRVVPLIGMIDLSPLIALLLLNVALMLVSSFVG